MCRQNVGLDSMKHVTKTAIWACAMVAPAALLCAVLLVLPALRTVQWSVSRGERPAAESAAARAGLRAVPGSFVGVDNFRRAFYGAGEMGATYGHTARVALLFVPPCIVAGVVLALLIRRTGDWSTLFYRAFLFVALLGSVPAVLMMHAVFHRLPGPISQWFPLSGPVLEGEFIRPVIAFAAGACGWQYVGVAVVIFALGLRSLPIGSCDAARLDGATGWSTLWRVTIPGLGPAVLLAFLAGLVAAMKIFAQVFVPAGGADETRLYSILSHLYLHAFGPRARPGGACALVVFWTAGCAGLGGLCWLLSNVQRRYAVETPPPAASRVSWLSRAAAALGVAALLGPLVIGLHSMSRSPAGGRIAMDRLAAAAGRSALVALAAGVGAGLLGSLAAFPLVRLRFPGRRWAAVFFLLLAFLPAEAALVGQVDLFARAGLTDTLAGLILAHMALSLPLCVVVAAGGFWDVPRSLDRQAAVSGCSPGGTWGRIMVPATARTLAVAIGLGALFSWNEFLIALALTPGGTVRTLPVEMFRVFEQAGFSRPLLILTVVSLVPPFLAACVVSRYFTRGWGGRADAQWAPGKTA
jgi:ABC-type glycerol-3-phosphate transport system permease component